MNYLTKLGEGIKVFLNLRKGDRIFYYKGEILSNDTENETIVIRDNNNTIIYCKYESILDLEFNGDDLDEY